MTIDYGIPLFSTISGAAAAINAIEALRREELTVTPLQDYYQNQLG
jgi:hypothetical protein